MSESATPAADGASRPVDRSKTGATRKRDDFDNEDKIGFFARIVRFITETINEMKKVRYPTKEELWTYFLVVVVFVAILMIFTGVIDLGASKLSILVFG